MIEWVMIGALGFFLGCLLALMLAPPLWNRAVKLTTRKLEATMPMSLADIQADKDQLRAEYAVAIRKVEVALEKAKEKATRELVEANKRRVELQVLNAELAGAKAEIQEKDNANRVLQQTIKRRLPDLDSRLKEAKKAITDLETVNTELRATMASQSEALKTARATLHTQRGDIDRLRASLEAGGGRGSSRADSRYLAESQRLAAELSRAQEELSSAHSRAEENAMLRQEMSRLASQILHVTRGQELHPRTTVDITQAFTRFVETQVPQAPETTRHGGHGGNGEERDQMHEEVVEEEVEIETAHVEISDEVTVEVEETEIAAEEMSVEAEAAQDKIAPDEAVADETVPAETVPDETVPVEAVPVEDAPAEAETASEKDSEIAEPIKRPRKPRRRKGRGKTLSERLRGLVATSPETHS